MSVLGRSLAAVVVAMMTAGGFAQGGHMARLTSTEGYVHVLRADNPADNAPGDPGVLNMPLIEGSTVATEEDGQAEIEFEDGSLARLTPNSALTLSRVGGASGTQLVLAKGLAYFELRAAPGISYTVMAADDRLHPTENTTVRVNLDEPPPAIAVLDGTLQVERPGSYATDVRAGETFRADIAGSGRYFLTQEIAPDTWDTWNETRDQLAADAAARQTEARGNYAGDKGYGWSDLDANGTWYDAGPQGQVWQPAGGDAADFDPYGNGNWVWYPSSGYLWASAYPWGWTPFRCGSWSYWGGFGWGWAPAGNCVSFGFGGGYGGYGGFGGGNFVNIRLAPRGYPVHRPPSPTRPGLHPIVPVHGETVLRTSSLTNGPRMINGVRATPLRGTALSYTARGGAATGAGLLRDFPVDRATRAPVIGVRPGEGRGNLVQSSALSGSVTGQTNGIPMQTMYGNGQIRGGVAPPQRAPGTYGTARPAQPQGYPSSPVYGRAPARNAPPQAYPSSPVYGRAPVSNVQVQRVQPAYAPRPSAPAAVSRPAPAPAPAAHASAPAASSSGKK